MYLANYKLINCAVFELKQFKNYFRTNKGKENRSIFM